MLRSGQSLTLSQLWFLKETGLLCLTPHTNHSALVEKLAVVFVGMRGHPYRWILRYSHLWNQHAVKLGASWRHRSSGKAHPVACPDPTFCQWPTPSCSWAISLPSILRMRMHHRKWGAIYPGAFMESPIPRVGITCMDITLEAIQHRLVRYDNDIQCFVHAASAHLLQHFARAAGRAPEFQYREPRGEFDTMSSAHLRGPSRPIDITVH